MKGSAGLMRSTLRDCCNRLKNIRQRAGKNDDEGKKVATTGDPFRDRTNEFTMIVKNLKEQINERNAGVKKNGQDRTAIEQSNEIRKEMKGLEVLLVQIQELVSDADRQLAKENKKKKPKANKVMLLERQLKDREAMLTNCKEMLEAVRMMDAQRFGSTGKAMNMGQEVQLGKKMNLRKQLMDLKRQPTQTSNVGPDGEMTEQGGSRRLEDDPETQAQMKTIADQERKINAGLDRLSKGVGRLHELSLQIGGQLDVQNTMLDQTENVVDKQTKTLKGLNRRLGKLVKEQSPMNMFINVMCVFLLLGLVGFFLVQFGAV